MHKWWQQWGKWLLVPLVIGVFLPGWRIIWETYSSFWLWENAIAAGVIALFYAVIVWQSGLRERVTRVAHASLTAHSTSVKSVHHTWADFPGGWISLGLISSCLILLVNNALGGFKLVMASLAYLSLYYVLGFWLTTSFWKKSILVFVLFILTLPVLEYLQQAIGFPLRLVTSQAVSWLLQLIGVGHISNTTVILTENYATTIDLPCSGVKSLYFGGVILLAVYFLQQIKLSVKSVGLAIGFFGLLLFFNIWRVFGLVYVYGVLHFVEAGDNIHVMLGLVGFAVSCGVLWQGTEKLRRSQNELPVSLIPPQKTHSKKWYIKNRQLNQASTLMVCLVTLLLTGILTQTLLAKPISRLNPIREEKIFNLPATELSDIPLTTKEQTLFFNSDVSFAHKYAFQWQGKAVSLLLVKSASARTHHNPEICLQGLGYRLVHEEILPLADDQIKHVEVQTATFGPEARADVYYWYLSKENIITDYSERVWTQFRQPNQPWMLVEVAVLESEKLTSADLDKLFTTLNQSVRQQLL